MTISIMNERTQVLLRSLPAMEIMLSDPRNVSHLKSVNRDLLKNMCSSVLDEFRRSILEGERISFDEDELFGELDRRILAVARPSLVPVVNGTGVVVHTNLGRSCLAPEAASVVDLVSRRYDTLEYDLEAGERGHRNSHVEGLLCCLTGAEAAVVVNNNAGAVLLCLAALGSGKSAMVSRGELVEIGGSFRIPDIMAFSGVRLVEVGATNRTHLRDYERALEYDTSMVMKVHPSNFRILGFHSEVSREELARLSHERDLIFMEDLGSGILVDLEPLGLAGEPTVAQCLEAGVDLVTFSGDKLLGGPQIGGIVGRKALVDRIRTHPLLRALRCDKMTLAAFEATLRIYLRGEWRKIPTLDMLARSPEAIRERCDRLAAALASVVASDGQVSVTEVQDAVGGGAFPATDMLGYAVAVRVGSCSAGRLQERLRACATPVIAGARDDTLLIHGRTLLADDDERVVRAFTLLVEEGWS